MRRVRVLALCAAALARCGAAEAPGPRMDDLSRRTLEAWHAKEHHLGRAGVKHARCTLEATLPGPAGAPRTTRGALLWDGKRARTTWDDEELVGAADYDVRDWCDFWFGSWWSAPRFEGVRLWGRRNGDGSVTIEFTDADDEPCVLSFNAEGVLTDAAWGTGDRRRTERYGYERRDGKWLLVGSETRSADGALVCKAEVRHEPAAGYLVPASMRITDAVMSGDATAEEVSDLRFTGWDLDDDAE